jgi:intracellular septation protein
MSTPRFFSTYNFKRMLVGTILEFGPIFVFLGTFPHFHIYVATTFLMIATILSTIATYALQKRLPYVALYVTLITIIFGYMTIHHREPKFIQMRDTLYDLTCAATLVFGLVFDISFLKFAFNQVLPMTTRAWQRVTYAWIGFFLVSAGVNEYIRRTGSLHEWFLYKDLMVVVTIVFGIVVLSLCYQTEKE